jgi:hypothetical protein
MINYFKQKPQSYQGLLEKIKKSVNQSYFTYCPEDQNQRVWIAETHLDWDKQD